MKKLIILAAVFVLSAKAFAKSTVVGTWVDDDVAPKTLLMQILDNPAEPPFTAGDLWNAMKTNDVKKSVTTANFKLTCSAVKDMGGQSYGSCDIEAPVSKGIERPQSVNFAVGYDEGKAAFDGFKTVYPNFLLKYGGRGDFIFEANWHYQMVVFVLSKSLISK